MGRVSQMFRTRVGIAVMGAFLVGGVGAILGAGSVWRPAAPGGGMIVQGNVTATSQNATATVAPTATATTQPTATTAPTAAPTATRNPVGSTVRGTVISVDTGANSLIISSNGVRYTIQVNDATTYSGAATQLSDIQPQWRVSVTVAALNGSAYLARSISASLPDN